MKLHGGRSPKTTMATVNGPLFSIDAAGQIGKALVYNKWKGRAYVREYVTPNNPNDIDQTFRRQMLAALTGWWQVIKLNATWLATWQAPADAENYSPFNAFQSFNLNRQTLGTFPQATYTANATAPAGEVDTVNATGGVNSIAVMVNIITDLTTDDLLILTLGTNNGANTTARTIRRIIAHRANTAGGASWTLTVRNIPAGNYFLAANVLGPNAVGSAWVNTGLAITVTGEP